MNENVLLSPAGRTQNIERAQKVADEIHLVRSCLSGESTEEFKTFRTIMAVFQDVPKIFTKEEITQNELTQINIALNGAEKLISARQSNLVTQLLTEYRIMIKEPDHSLEHSYRIKAKHFEVHAAFVSELKLINV